MKQPDNERMERYFVAVTLMLHDLVQVMEAYMLRRQEKSPTVREHWSREDQAFADCVSGALRLVLDAALRGLAHPAVREVRRPYQLDLGPKTGGRLQ